MRAFKVRTKNAKGKPISEWRTVHANSEKEAVLIDAQNQQAEREQKQMANPFKFPKPPRMRKGF